MDRFLIALPIIIVIESFAASIILCVGGRWGSAIYWFSAGLLNFAVIFLVGRFG